MKLGPRLSILAACVPPGATLADIGTDHGFLPIALVAGGRIGKAIAGDVVKGPYQAALSAVGASGYMDKISVRLGDGLAVVAPGEVDTVVIAGMGGSTIVEILTSAPAVIATIKRLILQPMIGAGSVRRWLASHGWRLEAEYLVEDSGRIYEIIVAENGSWDLIEEVLYEIGPLLWRERHPLLRRKMESAIRHQTAVTQEMARSRNAVSAEKYVICVKQLQAMKEKLLCL